MLLWSCTSVYPLHCFYYSGLIACTWILHVFKLLPMKKEYMNLNINTKKAYKRTWCRKGHIVEPYLIENSNWCKNNESCNQVLEMMLVLKPVLVFIHITHEYNKILQETHWRKRQRTAANPTCSLRRNCKHVIAIHIFNTIYYFKPTNFNCT